MSLGALRYDNKGGMERTFASLSAACADMCEGVCMDTLAMDLTLGSEEREAETEGSATRCDGTFFDMAVVIMVAVVVIVVVGEGDEKQR